MRIRGSDFEFFLRCCRRRSSWKNFPQHQPPPLLPSITRIAQSASVFPPPFLPRSASSQEAQATKIHLCKYGKDRGAGWCRCRTAAPVIEALGDALFEAGEPALDARQAPHQPACKAVSESCPEIPLVV